MTLSLHFAQSFQLQNSWAKHLSLLIRWKMTFKWLLGLDAGILIKWYMKSQIYYSYASCTLSHLPLPSKSWNMPMFRYWLTWPWCWTKCKAKMSGGNLKQLEHFWDVSCMLLLTVWFVYGQWIPLSQFSAQDYMQDQKMLKKMIDVCISTLEGGHNGFSPRNMQTGRKRSSRYFYYNTDDCKDWFHFNVSCVSYDLTLW